MRLLEAIIAANGRAVLAGGKPDPLPAGFTDALPLAALTCIDARLNRLIPEMLGVSEDKFIWLRNAGNIVTGPMSSTMRSLALACAVKGGREIAVIGHADCLVAKSGMMQLLDSFSKLGVERAKLPENLTEFFGVFSSERQNVINGCKFIRQSPLIGAKVPVHGLLMDIQTGKLDWIVNGYEPTVSPPSGFAGAIQVGVDRAQVELGDLKEFKLGDMKFPDSKIGEVVSKAGEVIRNIGEIASVSLELETPKQLTPGGVKEFVRHIIATGAYKVVGDDKRQYGPISGEKLLQWIAEDRVDGKTLVQPEGSDEWKPLELLGDIARHIPMPKPPLFQRKLGLKARWPGQK